MPTRDPITRPRIAMKLTSIRIDRGDVGPGDLGQDVADRGMVLV
jgi:hypothetical protein